MHMPCSYHGHVHAHAHAQAHAHAHAHAHGHAHTMRMHTLKEESTASRCAMFMPPLSLTTRMPAFCSRCSMRSSIATNCEKTMAAHPRRGAHR